MHETGSRAMDRNHRVNAQAHGWTFEDVKTFMGQMVEWLINALHEGAQFVDEC